MVPDRVGKEEAARRIGARPVSIKQHQKTDPVPGTDSASAVSYTHLDVYKRQEGK